MQIEPGKLEALKAALKAARAVDAPIVLIGASARDVFLVCLHNIEPERRTMDVDCAVKVKDWDHYRKLRSYMTEHMNFQEDSDPNHPERLIDGKGNRVDILPFGGVENIRKGSISWPGDIEMSVVGFDETLQSAETLRIPDGSGRLEIPVVNLAGIVLLKLIAWISRENDFHNRRKHVKDIYTIISHYSRINSERLEDGADSDLAELYSDALFTGARMLGRDIRRLCQAEAEREIDELLRKQSAGKGTCLFNQDLRKHCQGTYSKARELVQVLYEGFSEAK